MNKFEVKKDSHIILKVEHLGELLSNTEYNNLIGILELLDERKKLNGYKQHRYYICNVDEPYSEEVLSVIKKGELKEE